MPAMMLQRPCLMRIFIVPTLQRGNGVVTLQRHQDGIAPSPGGVLFFACPKKRTKRKGSPAAETTPVDGLRNRRGKNSLRSDSLPLFPCSAPRRPAQRQRAVFHPRKPILPRITLSAGPAPHLTAGNSEGIVATLERGNDHTLPRHRVDGEGDLGCGRIAANRGESEAAHGVERNGTLERPGGAPTLERGNDQNPRIDRLLITPIPPTAPRSSGRFLFLPPRWCCCATGPAMFLL